MIFYLLGLLSYYKLRNQPVPAGVCLLFFGVVTVPPTTTLLFFIKTHWTFQAIAFAGGLFCWTFIEYFVHRFWLHRKANKHYHNSDHFAHHTTPETIFTGHFKRLAIASLATMLLAASILFSSYLFILSGILTGYAIYGYMHVWLRQQWAAKWLSGLQKFHMRHHLGQTDKCFGVTFTWWDHVFNTSARSEKIGSRKTKEFYFTKRIIHS